MERFVAVVNRLIQLFVYEEILDHGIISKTSMLELSTLQYWKTIETQNILENIKRRSLESMPP